MIAFEEFGRLRLSQFLPAQKIVQLQDWEFMDRMWIGEACGFSEWLRLESEPNILRSLALDLVELPDAAISAILQELDLPLQAGMSRDEVQSVLGPSYKTRTFVEDRDSYEFIYGEFRLSCTVHHSKGLIYLVVMMLPDQN